MCQVLSYWAGPHARPAVGVQDMLVGKQVDSMRPGSMQTWVQVLSLPLAF